MGAVFQFLLTLLDIKKLDAHNVFLFLFGLKSGMIYCDTLVISSIQKRFIYFHLSIFHLSRLPSRVLAVVYQICRGLQLIRLLAAMSTNLIPLEREQSIHTLQTPARGLRNKEPGPHTTDARDDGKQPEGACGTQAVLARRQQHVGHGAAVAVLIDKVETHDHARGDGADAQGVDLGVEQVLHAIPAHGPAETRQIDHDDGACAGMFLRFGEFFAFLELGHGGQEGCNVAHGQRLQTDAYTQRAFATDYIDEK